ncbi:MAG: hypothetical protein IPN15_15995 [Saprospiraceae bacterium]|nr:hypothetical protein [Candidatus Vicinibacter affinis]
MYQMAGTFGIRSIFEDKEGSFWICNTWHKYIFDYEKTAKSDILQYRKTEGIGNEKYLTVINTFIIPTL